MFALRVVSVLVLIPVLVGLVFLGEPWYTTAVMSFVALGLIEVTALLRSAGYRPIGPVMIALGLVFPLDALGVFGELVPGALAAGAAIALLLLMSRPSYDRALLDWALTLAPPLYIGGLLQYFVPLRASPDGVFWPLAVLGLSWTCDTAAYAVGRLAGRTKLAPRLSPTKTREGAMAGIVLTLAMAALVATLTGRSVLHLIGFGAVVAVATVLGDLMESFLKRQCGAKDSGVLIPGHGGVLDRMDSLLLSAAAAYGYQVLTAWGSHG
ncbi:MAG: phosphatidate cytidylyltransferase [Chloroflexota bacterium]